MGLFKKIEVRTIAKNVGAVAAATIFMIGVSACSQGDRPQELRIGTASQGGAFYPIGQSISSLVSTHADGLRMVPIATFGSVGNPRLVDSREMDIAISSNNLVALANKGVGPYTTHGQMNLKAIGPLHYSILHMMTLAGNDSVNEISDLRGKRVAVGPAGGGTIPFLKAVLELEGLTIDDIIPSYLSYADGFSQLSDDNVDAAFALSGFPAGAVMQARAGKPLKFINLTPAQLATVKATSAQYTEVNVPKAIYDTPEDGAVLGVLNVLIADADMEPETAYQITKSIYGNLEEFRAANAIAKQIDLDKTKSINISLHDGAARYFREQDIEIPNHE